MGFYLAFIDSTKAFNMVNRTIQWEILKKLGYPEKFVVILWSFHDGMEVWISGGRKLSEPISVKNRVKQGYIPVRTLFFIYIAMIFYMAIKYYNHDIYKRSFGHVFNIRWLAFYLW